MGIEALLVVLGVVLFGGMFVGLWCSYLETAKERESADSATSADAQRFYADVPDASDDRTILYIEHYLRRERLEAQRFADSPSVETLLQDDNRSVEAGE